MVCVGHTPCALETREQTLTGVESVLRTLLNVILLLLFVTCTTIVNNWMGLCSPSPLRTVVAATVTINFRISAAFSQNEVVDIVRHVEPHISIHMHRYVCVCVFVCIGVRSYWHVMPHGTRKIETGVSKRSGRRVLCSAAR